MYKLSVCIYLNHVPFDAFQKLMSLKVRSNLGPPKKMSKSPKVGRFSDFYVKKLSISPGYLEPNFWFFISLILLD